MVGGAAGPVQVPDVTGIFVESRSRVAVSCLSAIRMGYIASWAPDVSEDIYFGPEIARGSQRWQYHIGIIDTEGLMNPVRAYVTNCGREIARDLPLDVEIPLHHIVAPWMRFQRPVLVILFCRVYDVLEGPCRKFAGSVDIGGLDLEERSR